MGVACGRRPFVVFGRGWVHKVCRRRSATEPFRESVLRSPRVPLGPPHYHEDGMRFRLIPRDESFYPLFDEQAQIAADSAIAVGEMLASLPVSAEAASVVVAAEKRADGVLRTVRDQLEHAIVTPFDREDIQALSNALDDVIDEMRAAADAAFQHNITTQLPGIEELLRILCDITARNVALVHGLRTLRNLTPVIDEIERLESEADGVYRKVMAELFSGRHDALDILRWKDVVEAIESAIDAVEDASDEVQSIAVKHA